MPRNRLTALLLLILCWSCAHGPELPPSAVDAPASNSTSASALDPSDVGMLRVGVDSAAALFEFGEVNEFLAARDSLRDKIETLVHSRPSLRQDPEFAQLLENLAALDSLTLLRAYTHENLAEVDSLALSVQPWPDAIDSTVTISNEQTSLDTVFPYMRNDRIDFWIRYFTGPGKERFARAVYRMQLYRPMIEETLDEMNLPRDLICVALIESGFNLKARSRARAVGPWQFIAGTGRIYGLRVNWWFDERRDIVASTYAAGNYLTDLYGIWQSWPLALAAYNCGEYRVARAIARQRTSDFWQLQLPKQTERYVPKFLAALYIVRDPESYGFTIPDVEPVKFDVVTVDDATDLKLVAQSAGTTLDVIEDLNPQFLRSTTPPKMKVTVKVPPGSGSVCQTKLDAIPVGERVTWRQHRVKQGETLSQIADQYGTSVSALKKLNNIKNAHRIRAGQSLIVPLHGPVTEVASVEPEYKTKRRNLDRADLEAYAKKFEPPSGHKEIVYRVKDGDTLGEIAEWFHTSASRIRAWNNLSYRSYIYPGQKLRIYVPENFEVAGGLQHRTTKPTEADYTKHSYVVRSGDTVHAISRRFNVSVADILAWNNVAAKAHIYPGQTLEIWQKRQ